jgi:hypothetical protein
VHDLEHDQDRDPRIVLVKPSGIRKDPLVLDHVRGHGLGLDRRRDLGLHHGHNAIRNPLAHGSHPLLLLRHHLLLCPQQPCFEIQEQDIRFTAMFGPGCLSRYP